MAMDKTKANTNTKAKALIKFAAEDASLIDRYIDAVWMERGLSKNSLEAYSRDLRASRWVSQRYWQAFVKCRSCRSGWLPCATGNG